MADGHITYEGCGIADTLNIDVGSINVALIGCRPTVHIFLIPYTIHNISLIPLLAIPKREMHIL